MNLERKVTLRMEVPRAAVGLLRGQSLCSPLADSLLADLRLVRRGLRRHGFDLSKTIDIKNEPGKPFRFEQALTLQEAAIHALRQSPVKVVS